MGRNQTDLILVLSILLIGSLFYTQALKDQRSIIQEHYKKAKKENSQRIQSLKNNLLEEAAKYRQKYITVKAEIESLENQLPESTFALSDKNNIALLNHELNQLASPSGLPSNIFKNKIYAFKEEVTLDYIKSRIDYFDKKKNIDSRQNKFTFLIENMDVEDSLLNLKITPFNQYTFEDNELYALSDQDTSMIAGPDFQFCGSLNNTEFFIKNARGNTFQLTKSNPVNTRS